MIATGSQSQEVLPTACQGVQKDFFRKKQAGKGTENLSGQSLRRGGLSKEFCARVLPCAPPSTASVGLELLAGAHLSDQTPAGFGEPA